MQVISVVSCNCGKDECDKAIPNIVCLMAESQEDRIVLAACIEDTNYSVETINLPQPLTKNFWIAIETEQRIFQSGKQLLPLLMKRRN